MPGTQVDIPIWLAVSLATREIVDLKNPKFMTQNYYAQLKAGADVVTMRAMSPYIYEAVIKISEGMIQTSAREALELYQAVFVSRFSKLIIDHSNQTEEGLAQAEDFSGTLAKKMTNLEKEIFDMHRKQKGRFQAWKNREGAAIEINPEFAVALPMIAAKAAEEPKSFKRMKTHS